MNAPIKHEIEVSVYGHHPSLLAFTYDPADPYAVSISCGNSFRFGRQLLSDGMSFPAGDLAYGDVMVQPIGDEILIDLHGVDEFGCPTTARLSVDADALAAFLDETFAAVPEGAEALDVDSALAELLGGVR